MKFKIPRKVKIIVIIAALCACVWFIVISPIITFKSNEKRMEEAAIRYFELNSSELPTGNRVKAVTLKTLFHKAFLKENINIPLTNKSCSIDNSWVKVRKENGVYKYYTYLECGAFSSNVDHKGPVITLKGEDTMTIGLGEKYEDPGIKSVVDNVDGDLKISSVTIKGEVDTSKVGTYEVTYTAYDSLSNKGEVVRKVKVVQKAYNTVKNALGDKSNYTGTPLNNYVRLSNMLFRIYGIDKNKNIILVSDEDIANINYSKFDDWLDYYYDNLNDKTKKMIVKSKYCNMKVDENTLNTTECKSYTKERNVYIPSVIEVNSAAGDGSNFMRPTTISWIANKKDDKVAYVTRNVFFDTGAGEHTKTYLSYSVDENYGIRPMFTIKGSSLITGGDGSSDNPYVFGDVKKAKGGSKVNERFTGEYISLEGMLYRIISTLEDGTTKVISNFTVGSENEEYQISSNPGEDKITYNPKNSSSAAYYINNNASKFITTEYFVKHKISVPIYKNKIIYGEETETKEYEVVLSAPNMYEMFSAIPKREFVYASYWYLNTSKGNRVAAVVMDGGVPVNEKIGDYDKFGMRVVGYLKKDSVISSGDGTINSPYIVK